MVGPPSADSSLVSPAVFGIALERQTPADPRRRFGIKSAAPPIKRLPAGGGALDPLAGVDGGFDPDAEACHVCLGGRLGCPFCFEFPAAYLPSEFAYAPDDDEKDDLPTRSLPTLHTDLTTRQAIIHHRRRRARLGDVLIKSMPCGEIVRLTLETTDTVDHVHHLFRSNSPFGVEETAVMFLPTASGLLAFDVDARSTSDDGSKLAREANVPVFKYGLNRRGAKAVLFHGLSHAVTDVIQVFINTNLRLDKFPLANRVVNHLYDKPHTLPGTDLLQLNLWDLFELQERQHVAYRKQDDASRILADKLRRQVEVRAALLSKLADRQNDHLRLGLPKRRRPVADKRKLHDLLASLSPPKPQTDDDRASEPAVPMPGLRLPPPKSDLSYENSTSEGATTDDATIGSNQPPVQQRLVAISKVST